MMYSRFLLMIALCITSIFSLYAADDRLEKMIKDFDLYAEKEREAWKIPGMAIGIIKDNDVVFIKGYGQRGLTDTRLVDENTVFQIGSLSKAFTAALVAVGVDKGWVRWQDKVIDHLPTFRMDDPWVSSEFQIVDLLCQRSGLPPYAGDAQAFLGYSADEMIDHLRFLNPVSSFRSQYAYQNIFFVVAANILEKRSRMKYQQLLEDELFKPLNMKNTTASLKGYLDARNKAEWLVRLQDGSTAQLNENFPYREWNYTLGAAGGINSTVSDLCQWLIFQANSGLYQEKQIIPVPHMERMTRPMIYVGKVQENPIYYCLGWSRMDYVPAPIIWHDGSTLGVYNVCAFSPQERLGIVILTNVRNTKLAAALALQFFDMYYKKPDKNWSQFFLERVEQSKTETAKPRNPYPAMPLFNYTGKYYNPIYGDVEVKEENSSLVLYIGKNKQNLYMKPWDVDMFTLKWPLVEDNDSKVIFIPNDEGQITKMKVELFSKEGSGDFEKVTR